MHRRWWYAIALIGALVGCRREPVPAALIHVWRTDAPEYRDRHLEIREDLVVFGTGYGTSDVYAIVDVDAEPPGAKGRRYTLHYRTDDGARLQLRVILSPGTPESLRIEHTDEVWLPDPASAAASKGV